jgi:hypothetical protein
MKNGFDHGVQIGLALDPAVQNLIGVLALCAIAVAALLLARAVYRFITR